MGRKTFYFIYPRARQDGGCDKDDLKVGQCNIGSDIHGEKNLLLHITRNWTRWWALQQ